MAIKGLTERRRFQRMGKIRLGIKKVSAKMGKEYPAATDYFVLTDAPDVARIYGEQPRTLHVLFFFDNIEANLPHYMKRYTGRGLRCLGDGEIVYYRAAPVEQRKNGGEVEAVMKPLIQGAVARNGPQPEEYGPATPVGNSVACPGLDCPLAQSGECRPTGRLHVGIQEVPRLGYYELVVHQRALIGLISQMELARALFGHLTDIPWLLHLAPDMVQVDGQQRKIYTPWVEIDPSWLSREMARRGQHKQLVAARRQEDIALLFGENGDDIPLAADVEELDYESKEGAEIAELSAEDEEVVEDTPAYARDPDTLRTLGDLFNAAWQDLKWDQRRALKELGVATPSALADTPADCYRQLAALAQVPG